MDLPGRARAPPRAVPDRRARAHQRARASSTRSATTTSPTSCAAGIDVFSTVNVQHLESLNDQVAELTGVRVRETVPDDELESADEIVLVDLPPEDLITRLQDGKVYAAARVPGALERLLPGREPARAARGRAAPGGRDRRGAPRRRAADRGAAARPGDARRARRARGPPGVALRPAARQASSTCSCSRTPPSTAQRRRLEELRRLTAMLGAHLLVEEGDAVEVLDGSPASAGRRTSCSARRSRRACASRCC